VVHLGACPDRSVCCVRRTGDEIGYSYEKELSVRRVEEYLDAETGGRSGKGQAAECKGESVVSAEGIESAHERNFNNLAGPG